MAEEVTQITRPSPIIEEAQKAYLTSLRDQVETPLDTAAFAPSVVGKTALDQAVQQQQATQAGLGTLQFGKFPRRQAEISLHIPSSLSIGSS